VFLSEYYYGINDWFKMQIAGKRIIKLVKFTRENDEARAEYAAKGVTMLGRLTAAEGYLEAVETVTNTMAGAKKNLEDYNKCDHPALVLQLSVHRPHWSVSRKMHCTLSECTGNLTPCVNAL
jgi:hypothetical protein